MKPYSRRHFLLTFGAGTAALLAGCGGSNSPGAKINQSLNGDNGNGGSDLTGRKKALVYGNPTGAVLDEYKSSYNLSPATAGSDPSGCDLLIVHGPSFPGQALKTDKLIEKTLKAHKDIAFLSATGEQKAAALAGRVSSYTRNDSDAYHIQFTKDANGKPSVRGTDMAVSAGAAAGRGVAVGAGVDRAGAELFAQIVRGETPPEIQKAAKSRQASGDDNGTVPIGAQYARDSQITILTGPTPSGQNLYLIAANEIIAIKTGGVSEGAGFQAVLFTDGFLFNPAQTRTFDPNAQFYTQFGYYPVAIQNDVAVAPSQMLPNNSLTVQGSPLAAAGETDSITDSVSLSIKSNGIDFGFSSSHTRTLTDWGFAPTTPAAHQAGFQWFQQVPYRWDKPGEAPTLGALPLFGYGGFAFHNTVTAATNVIYTGTLDFNGTFATTFHNYTAVKDKYGVTWNVAADGALNGSYVITVDWSQIPAAG